MEKRGLAHVEVIISTVLFIGFVFFAILFFNPLDVEQSVDSSAHYALSGVEREVSSEMLVYSIAVKNEDPQNPFQDPLRIPLENPKGYKVRVEDKKGNKLPATYDYSENKVEITSRGERFFTVKFSDVFVDGDSQGGGTNLNIFQYDISSYAEKEIWAESKMKSLAQEYEEDYNGLRKKLNLPSNVDFAFQFNNPEENVIKGEREAPEDVVVFSLNERNEMALEDGSSGFSELKIKTW